MIDYAEKRDFIRVPVDCPITLQRSNTMPDERGQLLDISAGGLHFLSRQAMDQGDRLQVTVAPENPLTPPLEASVSVVRCTRIGEQFDVAAAIDTIEPVSYPIDD